MCLASYIWLGKLIVCTPPPPTTISAGGGVSLQQNFQKGGGPAEPQLLEGAAGKERVPNFFQGGGCNFHTKNKLKPEIFSDKKSL